MSIIKQTMYEVFEKHNWDFYRKNYREGNYSFDDIKKLHNEWYPVIDTMNKPKSRFNESTVNLMLNLSGSVVELGCGEGYLAREVLSKNKKISSWLGFDICDESLKKTVCDDKRYHKYSLTYPFQEVIFGSGFGTFVSTHTFEHLVAEEVHEIISRMALLCRTIIIEVPLTDDDYFWKGGGSAHVLDRGWNWFKSMMSAYELNIKKEIRNGQKRGRIGLWSNLQ